MVIIHSFSVSPWTAASATWGVNCLTSRAARSVVTITETRTNTFEGAGRRSLTTGDSSARAGGPDQPLPHQTRLKRQPTPHYPLNSCRSGWRCFSSRRPLREGQLCSDAERRDCLRFVFQWRRAQPETQLAVCRRVRPSGLGWYSNWGWNVAIKKAAKVQMSRNNTQKLQQKTSSHPFFFPHIVS